MFVKATNRLKKTLPVNILLIFGLLLLTLSSIAFGLAYLVSDLAFGFAFGITLLALLSGWWLASTRLHGSVSAISLLLLGFVLVFIWVGQLVGLTFAWLDALVNLLRQRLQEVTPLDTLAYQTASSELALRLTTLFSDLGLWLRSLGSGNPASNYTSVAFFWGVVIWLTSAWAGWLQCRQAKSMLAILPGGTLLIIALGYTYGDTQALLPFLFATLLLVALNDYVVNQQSWRTRQMDYPQNAHKEIYPRLVGLCFGVMIVAALIPRISIPRIIARVQTWLSPQFEQVDPLLESFGLNPQAESLGEIYTVLSGGLPRQHLIGSGPELSQQIVMSVRVNEGLSEAELEHKNIPLYWRAITYDRYTGHGWQTSEVELRSYAAEEPASDRHYRAHQILQQDFQFVTENNFIYAAGEIVSVNQDYSIAWRVSQGTTATLETRADFFAGSIESRVYQVYSAVPSVSEAQLRNTSGIYPAWVSDHYLALPASLPERVPELARRLSRNAPTPYDKVRAIEIYLRSYEYQLNLPAPPDHRELVDYFLFELRRGYCDYYASAMVVLARAIGIPARLAVGYTRGSYDPASQSFIVTEENAHSWVEVYFTGIGWVPFEPTAAQDEIPRASETIVRRPPELDQTIETETQETYWVSSPTQSWNWLVGLFLGVTLLPGVWFWLDGWYLRWLPPSRVIESIFYRLYRSGHYLGVPAQVADTPYEFAASLKKRLTILAQKSGRTVDIEATIIDIDSLSKAYVRASYSSTPPSNADKMQIITRWKRLRRKLLLATWFNFRQKGRKKAGNPARATSLEKS